MLAHNILVKSTAPSFSLYGRIKTGSFHEETKKVLFKMLVVSWTGESLWVLYFCHYIFALCPRKGPGPAAYKVVEQTIYSKKAPSYSMTGRNFPPGGSTQNPGPGAHCPEKVLILKTDENLSLFFPLSHLIFSFLFPTTTSAGDDDKGTGSQLHLWPTSLGTHLSSNINVDSFFNYFVHSFKIITFLVGKFTHLQMRHNSKCSQMIHDTLV